MKLAKSVAPALLAAALAMAGCVTSKVYTIPQASTAPTCFTPDSSTSEDVLIGLSVSGGGSRAALFAAGGMEALAKLRAGPKNQSVLEQVSYISSVSGGSLASAYYVVKKPRKVTPVLYPNGEMTDVYRDFFKGFKETVAQDYEEPLLWRNLSHFRWFNPTWTAESLTEILNKKYFGDMTFGGLSSRVRKGDSPYLMLNTTLYNDGRRFVFSTLPKETAQYNPMPDLYRNRPAQPQDPEIDRILKSRWEDLQSRTPQDFNFDICPIMLARVVTASMSFPPIIGPISFTVGEKKLSDPWITATTRIALASDNRVKGRQVSVTTENGALLLSGEVDDEQAKAVAEEIAKGIDGVKSVKNELQVAPPSSRDAVEEKDDDITKAVKKEIKNKRIKGADISVKTNAGVVSLTGTAPYLSSSADASWTARNVPGVKSVKNNLRLEEMYWHVGDGGLSDNSGAESLLMVFLKKFQDKKARKALIIALDSSFPFSVGGEALNNRKEGFSLFTYDYGRIPGIMEERSLAYRSLFFRVAQQQGILPDPSRFGFILLKHTDAKWKEDLSDLPESCQKEKVNWKSPKDVSSHLAGVVTRLFIKSTCDQDLVLAAAAKVVAQNESKIRKFLEP